MHRLSVLFLVLLAAACAAQQNSAVLSAPHASFVAELPTQHHFFDRANVALLAWNAGAETYDAITTRRTLNGQPIHELNPFGALFVNHGWGGQAAFSYGFGVGGPLLASYIFHRTGHHKLERWVTAINAFGSTAAGSWNLSH